MKKTVLVQFNKRSNTTNTYFHVKRYPLMPHTKYLNIYTFTIRLRGTKFTIYSFGDVNDSNRSSKYCENIFC